MDREIPSAARLSFGVATGLLLSAVGMLVLNGQISAQDRGFGRRGGGGFQMPSPEEMFARLDSNNDGSLSATEVNNSFMSRAFRDADLSNGLSREQFAEELQRMRERFGRGGGRGGPGGGSDSDRRRGRNGDDEGENRPEGDRSPDNAGQPDQQSQSGESSSPTPTSGAPAAGTNGRTRVTIDLQDDLLPGDTDRDGQVGMYEWRRFAGRSLREFQQLDLNGDGFVTPGEYATVHPAPAPAVAPAATATVAPATAPTSATADDDSSTAGGTAPATGSGSESAEAATGPADGRTTGDAERFFRLLDKNSDGQIAPGEWVDGRIRTMFTNDGIDLSRPLLAADFSRHYVRLSAND